MPYLLHLFLIFSFLSCKAQQEKKLEIKEVELTGLTKDSVISFVNTGNDTLNILREVEITHNDNSDTLLLGYSIIPPGFTGKIWFIQNGLDKSSAAYLDRSKELDLDDPNSYSKFFSVGLWNQKYEKGFGKIVLNLRVD